MQYNLLYYTENGAGDCDQTTNNLDTKDQAFKTIVKYVMPDVVTVNELGKGEVYPQRILDHVLNTNGVNYFAYAPTVSNPSSGITICNGLFYDTRKLVLKSTFYVSTSVTYFNAYRMYYRSNELAQGDTAFITFIVCHLKAGNSYDSERLNQARQLMNRLISIGVADNYVLCGDFNIYNASESAYQHFVHHDNSLVRFYDPIDREGEWDNNAAFADLFTQSTHSGGTTNGCYSGGGMDNRFDFILVSDFVKNGLQKVRCLPSTYYALGQDGNRRNGSIIDPTNTAVPAQIANALYTMSDHLPVIMDYQIDATLSLNDPSQLLPVQVVNPISDQLRIITDFIYNEEITIDIFTIDGRLLHSEQCTAGGSDITLSFPYTPAVYLVAITDSQGRKVVKRVVKL
jgi:exonuclease III